MQRKNFLSVTEQGLLREINQDDIEIDEEEEEEIPDSTETDKIHNLKLELNKNINVALNETSLALDLVSLLISSTKPNLAKTTISPHLSKTVPLGSFHTDRLSSQDNPPTDKDVNVIGQGWKFESLDKIKNLFKTKQEELLGQIRKEKVFWDDINRVLNNDEVLLKMRDPIDNSKAIGVKYGYGDSGSSYHDKGIAVLRRNGKSGEVSFAPMSESNNKLTNKVFKYVRVKILSKVDDEFMLTGQSKFKLDLDISDRLIKDIEKARFFIFEEDLFYQLIREARTLINYNVSIISDKIIIEINQQIIEIEAIQYDENEEEIDRDEESKRDNHKCQLILTYLKIMLCGYFKYNLNLKQKIPTNFTKFKQNNSHPLILRPFIGHIKHESNVNLLESMMNKIIYKYNDKIDFDLTVTKYENIKQLTAVESPFIKSIEKPLSTFKLVLKNSHNKCLKIDTQLTTSEIFVNSILNLRVIRYETMDDLKGNENGINVLKLSFNDFTEIEQSIDWSVQKFVADN